MDNLLIATVVLVLLFFVVPIIITDSVFIEALSSKFKLDKKSRVELDKLRDE